MQEIENTPYCDVHALDVLSGCLRKDYTAALTERHILPITDSLIDENLMEHFDDQGKK
ncbi:MAG: hypothetical protein LBB48_02300 [Treponema sp.]|jgi:hypothetical protein|nr:hypothetical protein [Treponema sp.]